MRISIETSQPHLVRELFKLMTRKRDIQDIHSMQETAEIGDLQYLKNILGDDSFDELSDLEDLNNSEQLLGDKEPSFVELLNYMRMLWSSHNSVYVNVLYNIVVYPQFMLSKERCTPKEYSIYKNVFNNKNYMPDIVILLYDENTAAMENMLNDPFFKIHVFKVQLMHGLLNETAQMLSDTLLYIYGNYVEDSSQFSYFEQCYTNYNCIDKKK